MKKSLVLAAVLVAAGVAQAQTATYGIDPTHTFVNFEAGHFGTSTVRGRFDKTVGSVSFDRAGKAGKVEITIDTKSINTGVVAALPVAAILFLGSFVLGADTLRDISLALLVGTLIGTYSTPFVASPFYSLLREREPAIAARDKKTLALRAKSLSTSSV
jgi:hypothetical protein